MKEDSLFIERKNMQYELDLGREEDGQANTPAPQPQIHGCRGCERLKTGYRGYEFCEACPKLQ